MKKLMISVVAGMLASCVYAQEDGARWYATTRIDEKGEQVPLSQEEIAQNRVIAHCPYYRNLGRRFLAMFGQMAKQCDGIFIGKVTKVRLENDAPELEHMNKTAFLVRSVSLTFGVETNLFGQLTNKDAVFDMQWLEGSALALTNGMRMMVFYARGEPISMWNSQAKTFDWVKQEENPKTKPAILNNSSGLRILDDPAAERLYIRAADEYMQLLRREKRDVDKYYAMLRRQIKSPVWRIREDAREDLRTLFRRPPASFDLNRVFDDPEIDDLLKDYIRYVVCPAREREKAEQQKTEQRQEEQPKPQ